MAKFLCVCGYQISTSGAIPNPNEWNLLSATDFEAFSGPINADDLYRATTFAYRCPQSDHLWIFWKGFDAPPGLYEPRPLPPYKR
jgi:hypothetical protein